MFFFSRFQFFFDDLEVLHIASCALRILVSVMESFLKLAIHLNASVTFLLRVLEIL